jgi:signal transduction histidine kinase
MEIKEIFEANGYRVLLAENGRQCLERLETERPDIILLDVKMPEMDGYEVCRRLKSNDYGQTVPVIFISASDTTAKKVEGFKAGGVDYIAKPFEQEEVLARVGVHLRLRELSEQLEHKVSQRTEELTLANQRLRQQIAERRRVEEELHAHRDQLEKLVKNRTVELEASNKELEAFAYSVSHDLRAPLRHIEGFLELLEKKAGTAPDEKSRHYMEVISDSAKKMGRLIDDLLSFSRMGRQAMAFQQVNLQALVRDVIQELEPDAADRTIDWRIGDLPVVSGDAAMLKMVLANLVGNALKFTRPRQKARIEINSHPGQDADTVIFVRDNGVGFDMTYGDRLFGVFQRLHRADEFEGTGIGLANVRRIIVRHGGRTWAEGRLDQGATFYFSLPYREKICNGGKR